MGSKKHEFCNIDLVIHVDEGRRPDNCTAGPDDWTSKQDPWDLPVFSEGAMELMREHLKEMTAGLINRKLVSEEDNNNNNDISRKSYIVTNTDADGNKLRGPVRSVSIQPKKWQHSCILDKKQLHKLRSWVPKRFKFHQPVSLFSTNEDGFSLQTMYQYCRNYSELALIIRTDREERFGAFIKCIKSFEDSRKGKGYFGTGESFVFSFSPVPVRYQWVGLKGQDTSISQNMFISAARNRLTIGGGNGDAIQLDSDLERGFAGMCDTFNNPVLCRDKHFRCLELEVLGFRS
ncbi:TBC1D24 [Branchiostoma lanceolatum]|uniref:TBC1D24 protein n=1 Tax=Branchiostoma lanceolatum TaxID=7740 RepID=A0A8K0EAE7_BRALA|nr:TBC1D24 [Branchiostoma lanceolatum]